MDEREAYALIPANAVWSSSFGNPGEGGYCEFWRLPDSTRYVIENGEHNPKAWNVRIIRPTVYA